FFVFFGLQVDPAEMVPVLPAALGLAIVAAGTKLATGWLAAGRAGVGRRGRLRAGIGLVARGEFSIAIAALGITAGADPRLGPFSAAFVVVLAVAGPVLARVAVGERRPRVGDIGAEAVGE
ncbi:MAG TPA: cation:proton antiporter, partial [Actinomycetota bacterium]|nr:cation:proton antiporter [Actinomycetota bacterium]